MVLQRFSKLLVLLACVSGSSAIQAATSLPLPEGLSLSWSGNELTVKYDPKTLKLDTLGEGESARIIPIGKGIGERRNKDGVVQYVLRSSIVLDRAGKFGIKTYDAQFKSPSMPLYSSVSDISSKHPSTDKRLEQSGDIRYIGVGGDQHLAGIEIIVAEERNGKTEILDNFRGTFLFAPLLNTSTNIGKAIQAKGSDKVQANELVFDKVAKVRIDKEGVYTLSAENLKAAGFPVDANAARTIKVFGRGGQELPESVDSALVGMVEQQLAVYTNGDGSINRIVFYGCGPTGWTMEGTKAIHSMNHYSTTASYMLTVGGSDGKRTSFRLSAPTTNAQRMAVVDARFYFEEDITSPFYTGSGRRWYGRSMENGGTMPLTAMLPGFARTGNVSYMFSLVNRGVTSDKIDGTGKFTVLDNNTQILRRNISAVPEYSDAFNDTLGTTMPANIIGEDGRSNIKIQFASDHKAATAALDWYEILYPRKTEANGGNFDFWFNSAEQPQYAEVSGFSGEIFGYDVTNRAWPQPVENASVTAGVFTVSENVPTGSRRYFISSQLITPTIESVPFGNLRLNPRNVDVIVITHPALAQSAQEFATYRQSQGEFTTTVVTTTELFNEFSYGMQDPTAIRDFLAHAKATWSKAPKYVVLWGDGHYDYRNIGTTVVNYVIPYESFDAYGDDVGLSTYTSDDYYARIVGNDRLVDLATGRIPVSSNENGRAFVEKLSRYENESSMDDWRTRVTLIADDGPTDPNKAGGATDRDSHLRQSELLWSEYIPSPMLSRKIYMVEYPTDNVAKGRRKPAVTADMVSTINTSGNLLLNWIGHGNPRVWAHEYIFARETTPALMTNADKPFFLTAATCDFARFDMTESQSGAEDLTMMTHGGAIGVFAASRVVVSSDNAEINELFYSHLFTRDEKTGKYNTVGEALEHVKQSRTNRNDEKFFLMADPTMRLLAPYRSLVFDSIDAKSVLEERSIKLAALQTVTVSGYITKIGGIGADSSFNGDATISLFDASQKISVFDDDKYKTLNQFIRPGAALSRGTYIVKDGRFTSTFIIPKDIAFSAANAGMFGYAIADDMQTAMGMTSKVVVDGVTSVRFEDEEGPDIALYMDSRKFIGGGLVRSNPILLVDLKDSTGINTTGTGIGHNIEALFDGDRIENLTSNFTTSRTDSRAGTASKQIFGLVPGVHTVRVRAWDVLNNVSESSTTFRLADSSAGIVTEGVINYPNPFSGSTRIRFTHNVSRPFTAIARIFDMNGRMLFEQPVEVADFQTAEVEWNGTSLDGDRVGSGIYQAVIQIITDDGQSHDVGTKLNLIR